MTDYAQQQLENTPAELLDGISVIRAREDREHWNGLSYTPGISSRTVGARELSMNVATIPPGGIARAHIHVDFEVGLYIAEGQVEHRYGKGLTKSVVNSAGDFIFIEPGVPHEVYNMSDSDPVIAIVARSSPDQWDDIVDYDPRSDQ